MYVRYVVIIFHFALKLFVEYQCVH